MEPLNDAAGGRKDDGPMEARNKEARRDSAVRATTNRLRMR